MNSIRLIKGYNLKHRKFGNSLAHIEAKIYFVLKEKNILRKGRPYPGSTNLKKW